MLWKLWDRFLHLSTFGLLLFSLWITSCGRGGAPDEGTTDEQYKLELAGAQSYELMLPSLVAYANGYFESEGIAITGVFTASGSTIRDSILARDRDFALLAFLHTALAQSKGQPLKIILSTHDREIFSLLVRKGLEGDVKRISDLRGRNVGMTRPGSGAWAFARIFLEQAGLDPERDVNLISLGADAMSIYTAIKTARVDAFPSWEPITSKAISENVAYPLVRMWESDEHAKWIGGPALSMTLVTRQEVIQNKPKIVQRVVNAHRKGLEYLRTEKPEQIVELLFQNPKTKEQFSGLDRSLAIEIVEKIKGGFGTGALSRSGFQNEVNLTHKYGLIDRVIPFDQAVDATFAGTIE